MTTNTTPQTTFTTRTWKEIVQKAWGKEYNKPDVVYQFSNGRQFESTDSTASGIYKD